MNKYILLIALIVSPLVSTAYSGSELLEFCTSPTDKTDVEFGKNTLCLGYLNGIADLHDILVILGDKLPLWCPPENVTVGQAEMVVIKYLKEHPEDLHLVAGSQVANAFMSAFPCK